MIQITEKEGKPASITLKLQFYKDSIKKRNYRAVLLINTNAKESVTKENAEPHEENNAPQPSGVYSRNAKLV